MRGVGETPRSTVCGPSLAETRLESLSVEPELVDNDAALITDVTPADGGLDVYRADIERAGQEKDQIGRAAEVLPTLRLAPANLERGREVEQMFADAGPDGDEAERLLLELVAGEIPVLLQLRDVEAAAVSLLGRTIMNPDLGLATAKLAKETSALLAAVRGRAEKSLGVVADLRAQRRFLASHRRKNGD